MSFEPGLPDIRIIIREAAEENLTVDVPNITVKVQQGDQYNVNVNTNTITPIRTGSFTTYADQAGNAYTASYAFVAQAVFGTIESASIALTASYVEYDNVVNKPTLVSSSTQVDYTQIQNQPTTIPTASYVLNAVSSSFALTASYISGAASTWDTVTNKPDGLVSSSTQVLNYNIFATTGSNTFIGSQNISGSVLFDNGAQIVQNFQGQTGSIDLIAGPQSGARAEIQWNAANFVWANQGGAYIGTNYDTSSKVWGFDRDGKLTAPGPITAPSFSGSLFGTASWASNAVSSSFSVTSSFSVSSSRATTSSFSITSSYASNADLLDGLNSTVFATTGSNVFNGNQTITGSLLTNADTIIFTGSIFTSGSLSVVAGTITGSLFGTASYADSASYIDGGFY